MGLKLVQLDGSPESSSAESEHELASNRASHSGDVTANSSGSHRSQNGDCSAHCMTDEWIASVLRQKPQKVKGTFVCLD